MKNTIEVGGEKAVISFDPDIQMFRGEFIGLSGGADFYSDNVGGLMEEGRKSLETYLALCEEKGIEPRRYYSGKFNVRLNPELHAAAAQAAAAHHKSLNEWVAEALAHAAEQTSQTIGTLLK